MIIPWAMPQYISALTWRGMFNQEYGSINLILTKFLHMDSIQWLSSPFEAFSACILTNIWLGFPFMMVIALGGLQSIPNDLYEAAEIDGAGRWKKFLHITLPEIRFVVGAIIMLRFIWNMNKFDEVFLLTPNVKTLPVYTYFTAFTGSIDQGQAASIAVVQFLLLIVMIFYYIRRVLKW